MRSIGTLRTDYLDKEFGKITTDEIIITEEREEHIKLRHPADYDIFLQFGSTVIMDTDIVIRDVSHEGTVFMIKRLEDSNLNVVVRIALSCDNPEYKNSVMTAYRLREKNLVKLIRKCCGNIIYKKE